MLKFVATDQMKTALNKTGNHARTIPRTQCFWQDWIEISHLEIVVWRRQSFHRRGVCGELYRRKGCRRDFGRVHHVSFPAEVLWQVDVVLLLLNRPHTFHFFSVFCFHLLVLVPEPGNGGVLGNLKVNNIRCEKKLINN